MSKEYKNTINLKNDVSPTERRSALMKEPGKDNTPFPHSLSYRDIDAEFKKWVEDELNVVFEGKKIPTVALFTSQRFSEYMQSWMFNDEKRNLEMNFKMITRENNPEKGTLYDGKGNIPGRPKFLVTRRIVEDENGRRFAMDYTMRQPVCVDLTYKVSIVTNKFPLLNDFNSILQTKFCALNAYIAPKGHFMPMVLETVSDESEYNAEDRQFFSQSFDIKVKGYIISDKDFDVEEKPIFGKVRFGEGGERQHGRVTIDECERPQYDKEPLVLTMTFDRCNRNVSFTMDCDMVVNDVELVNFRDGMFRINKSEVPLEELKGFRINDLDLVEVKNVRGKNLLEDIKISLHGYNPEKVIQRGEPEAKK